MSLVDCNKHTPCRKCFKCMKKKTSILRRTNLDELKSKIYRLRETMSDVEAQKDSIMLEIEDLDIVFNYRTKFHDFPKYDSYMVYKSKTQGDIDMLKQKYISFSNLCKVLNNQCEKIEKYHYLLNDKSISDYDMALG